MQVTSRQNYFINIQTLSSSWCEYEIQCARAANIPLLCVVDVDKQTVRSIVDSYMESGNSYLFDEQVNSSNTSTVPFSLNLLSSAFRL